MIETRNLSKSFGPLVAVDNVSFVVKRGEVLGFLGPNGAGKSTTMKMLAGFLAPSGGSAHICGIDVGHDPIAAKSRIGYLPEGAPLYGDMTPAQLLDFVTRVRGLDRIERRRRTEAAVETVQLHEVLHRPIHTLSKGFTRRVALAQALVHDPDVLILDEPTDGLDPNQKHEIRALLRALSGNKAIIVSTHILEEVDAVCTRAIIIARGKILVDETPSDLRAKHQGASLEDVFRAITLGKSA